MDKPEKPIRWEHIKAPEEMKMEAIKRTVKNDVNKNVNKSLDIYLKM